MNVDFVTYEVTGVKFVGYSYLMPAKDIKEEIPKFWSEFGPVIKAAKIKQQCGPIGSMSETDKQTYSCNVGEYGINISYGYTAHYIIAGILAGKLPIDEFEVYKFEDLTPKGIGEFVADKCKSLNFRSGIDTVTIEHYVDQSACGTYTGEILIPRSCLL